MSKRGDRRRIKDRRNQLAQSRDRRTDDRVPMRERERRGRLPKRHAKVTHHGDNYISLEWPPRLGAPLDAPTIQFLLKQTGQITNVTDEMIEFKTRLVENTIQPRQLSFDPPLREYGTEHANGFRHYWEMLDYVFGLPDPSSFPQIALRPEDRESVERFVTTCRRLATFSVINDSTVLSFSINERTNDWRVLVEKYPSDEGFIGASAIFRQLHSDGESASFTRAHDALFKVRNALPGDLRDVVGETVLRWRDARAKLMNYTLQTLTARKACKTTLIDRVSYCNVNPADLIRTFNYGDSLHFGSTKDQLIDLMADPDYEAYYKYTALLSIVGLSHLYFGFAVLLDRALGGVPVTSNTSGHRKSRGPVVDRPSRSRQATRTNPELDT